MTNKNNLISYAICFYEEILSQVKSKINTVTLEGVRVALSEVTFEQTTECSDGVTTVRWGGKPSKEREQTQRPRGRN